MPHRRSPSSSSSERRSHRHKSRRNEPPAYDRPKLSDRRPDLNRSLSEDTYRELTRDRHRDDRRERRHRERDRGDRERERDRDRDSDRTDRSTRDRSTRDRSTRDRKDRSTRDRSTRDRSHRDQDRSDRWVDRDRSSRRARYDSDSDSDNYYYDKHGRPHGSRSRSRSRSHDRLKNIAEDVLAAFGLVTTKDKVKRDAEAKKSEVKHRDHRDYKESMLDEGRSPANATAALRAAITAAALEAYRTRKEFGGMTPERLLRIAGAAIAAGGLDAIVQRDHGKDDAGGTRKLIESVIGGMSSSSAFGHRIRRRHGLSTGEQWKSQLMSKATVKVLDRPFGPKDGPHSLAPKFKRAASSNAISSLVRSLNLSDRRPDHHN